MRYATAKNAALAAALVAMVGAAVWWAKRDEPRHAELPAAAPMDDLALVVALLDGAAGEPARDVLVAGEGERYLARATDHAIVSVGAGRTLAVLDAPARGMVLAGGALWVTAGHAVRRIGVGAGGAGAGAGADAGAGAGAGASVAQGLQRPDAIAGDGVAAFVVDVAPATGGTGHAAVVLRLPGDGGPRAELGRSDGEITNLALDGESVYWADRLEGTIVAVPKAGGASRTLATGRGLPGSVVVDGDALYWVEKRSEAVWTMPKAGGAPPRQLVQDFAGFAHLLVDARGVVWVNEAAVDGEFRVLMVPRAGGDAIALSDGVDGVEALAGDAAHLYWERDGRITLVAPPAAR